MLQPVRYLNDADVDAATDAKLRKLLTLCFGDTFRDKRYCFEMPPHRWLVHDGTEVAAHLALHEKVFMTEGSETPFLGIAEVCVAPPYRGRGLVKAMLTKAEVRFPATPFSVLLGDPGVYGSSGYVPATNVYLPHKNETAPDPDVLVKTLRGEPWPEGKVVIAGPPF